MGAHPEQSERTDIDFIPGVGITTDRTGKSAAEAENNQSRLTKVNGLALEDYITMLCPAGGGSTVSKWAGQAGDYGSDFHYCATHEPG